jgi:enediyne biosynthesis protein E8
VEGKLLELTEEQFRIITLEAFADTFVPGEKRSPDDIAVAGSASGPGTVAAGALELLETPATGVSDGLADLAESLNEHAAKYAEERGISLGRDIPPFAALGFEDRTVSVFLPESPAAAHAEGRGRLGDGNAGIGDGRA